MKNLKAMITAAVFMITALAYAGDISISGKVTEIKKTSEISNVSVLIKGKYTGTITDKNGHYEIIVPTENSILVFQHIGFETQEIKVGKQRVINVILKKTVIDDDKEIVEKESIFEIDAMMIGAQSVPMNKRSKGTVSGQQMMNYVYEEPIPHNTEEYDVINENIFLDPLNNPLSTFSIDVDAASYSNMRRMINNGQLPQKDVVRIEEMINYFHYDYPNPTGDHPFSITTEVSQAPWNEQHQLLHIGLQGRMLDYDQLQPTNLVFLIDVSGSMSDPNKLPLLKSSMKLLVNELSENDRVAIVVYAGAAGLVLPSTPASEKEIIMAAFDRLQAGGSTAGGAGIKLAYDVALKNLIKNGNNRVVLATDGDFNIGASSSSDMVRLIEDKRDQGIFLTITGFGMGNYKDGRMEQISNAGNGNYFYIDNIKEAKKVFVTEMRATLFTIAKDVKIQVEFNPNKVQAYRLIGYENRMLQAEDFNDDKKDAGELGAGHTVTALYEIIPVGIESAFIKEIDPLKYQKGKRTAVSNNGELLTVKFRYKKPDSDKSKLITKVLMDNQISLNKTSDNYRFSAAVAELGMILRDSEFKSESSYASVLNLAYSAKGDDKEGYRAEFIQLTESCKMLSNSGKFSQR
jgi:Ca-activated chloride channel family protein